MNNDYLKDVYKDFFGEEKSLVTEEINASETGIDIDNLLIEEESKDLLKKIMSYMEKYHKKEEERYLNFHLLVQSDNKELLDQLEKITKKMCSDNSYTENNNSIKISFYDIENIDDFQKKLASNSIIVLKDIKGIDLKDEPFKKRLFHALEEEINKHKLFILEGVKEDIDHFFEYDSLLREKAFPFSIIGTDPDVQDLYQEILGIIHKDIKTEDELSVKILDYISETYEKREVDYPTYRDQLCRHILINGDVPTLETEKTIDEIFEKLNELVGLEKVKKTLHELVDYMTLRKKSEDLKLNNVNLHMVFLGNPGTGKTTVARLISEILYNLKYTKQNKLIEVSSKDLVAEYVGQTAPKTMGVVERALGGVLFIDEAYALASIGNQNSYNDEAIATLIKAMEDYRESVDRFSDTPQVVVPVWDSIIYVITLCFIVPVTEEVTFRGVIFGQLRRGFGPWVSVFLSAVLFGIMHGISVHIGYAIACGLIIAACYHITDSLVAPIILHAVFNIFGSGIANFMNVEAFGIPNELTTSFMVGINMTSMLMMPIGVLAFAYLVNVKRKQAKERLALEESSNIQVELSEENNGDPAPDGDDNGIEAKE